MAGDDDNRKRAPISGANACLARTLRSHAQYHRPQGIDGVQYFVVVVEWFVVMTVVSFHNSCIATTFAAFNSSKNEVKLSLALPAFRQKPVIPAKSSRDSFAG